MHKLFHFTKSFFETLISLWRIIFVSKWTNCTKTITTPPEEIIVMGNGPSLNESFKQNIDFFKTRKLLCVNGFGFSEYYTLLKPSYYVFADPGMWIDDAMEATKDFRNKITKIIIEKTDWDMIIFIPIEASKSVIIKNMLNNNKFLKVAFYNNTKIMGFKCFRNWAFKRQLGIPTAQNVIIPSLMLATNIATKQIFLVGADHTWHEQLKLREDNVLCIKQPHFYDNHNNDLIPIKDVRTKRPLKTHEFFESLVKTFKNYYMVADYATSIRKKIFNASFITFVDAFERYNITKE